MLAVDVSSPLPAASAHRIHLIRHGEIAPFTNRTQLLAAAPLSWRASSKRAELANECAAQRWRVSA